jgi:hypothetical protein
VEKGVPNHYPQVKIPFIVQLLARKKWLCIMGKGSLQNKYFQVSEKMKGALFLLLNARIFAIKEL